MNVTREARMVPADWRHPIERPAGEHGYRYKPLLSGDWEADAAAWDESARIGLRPDPADYMPRFDPSTATHLMMYEVTTMGTPISPAFITPEGLARWLVDNKVGAFAGHTATYGYWLTIARGAWEPSLALSHADRTVARIEDICAASTEWWRTDLRERVD